MAKISVTKILRSPCKINTLRTLNVLFVDEIGQLSADIISVFDIILHKIHNNNIFLGILLLIATIDHTQLQPMKGIQFLLSSYTLTCFKIICFEIQ